MSRATRHDPGGVPGDTHEANQSLQANMEMVQAAMMVKNLNLI